MTRGERCNGRLPPEPVAGPAQPTAPPDPETLVRSRAYIALLVFGAAVGVPVAAVAFFFLKAITEAQHYFYATLPGELGFNSVPMWWPAPLLVVAGVLVSLTIRYLPGIGGHKPAEGFKTGVG